LIALGRPSQLEIKYRLAAMKPTYPSVADITAMLLRMTQHPSCQSKLKT
jgi:hypothetical protein